jgi:hypothetical protein
MASQKSQRAHSNSSVANMGFSEFVDLADETGGVFRGIPEH